MSGGGGILSYRDCGLWSTANDYARFCQMLLDRGIGPTGRRVLKASTVRSLWQDSLTPFGKANGRVSGWNDYEGNKRGGFWDHHAWTLLNTTLDNLKSGPERGRSRVGEVMYMFGGFGASWAVDRRRQIAALSFGQTFYGAFWERMGDSGCYCLDFAQLAVDAASVKGKTRACGAAAKR
eukprot:CAMPEP_0172894902 /NCGR_PEP_ID=MMETSP1075-20121228/151919_1 /TAXON_ID=2916 /ORGANISM="Ceratium fusus, Strain PA161109" /LENGTH=178 /DNA_ID=CAMNT_0013750019 /DNA_START=44 /DNA_END=580 /DNA_ORIENTATION=+